MLTISAIIIGVVFGFLSGGLFLAGVTTAETAIGISGGVVETVLGAVALTAQRSRPCITQGTFCATCGRILPASRCFPIPSGGF